MAQIMTTVDVDVPVRVAYNQWTQFEEFPRFMEAVKEVRQLDDKRMHWRAEIGGQVEEWDAVITEQVPDERVAWRSTTGTENAGVVTFHRLSPGTTRVTLQMDYTPQGVVEAAGDLLGFASRQIEADLQRFKEFIESRGQETGAWRGEIEQDHGPGATATH